jgi:puromycin-sensitive aminopeptidase
VRYEPHLEVGLDPDTFAGRLVVDLAIEEACTSFQLHAHELEPREAELLTDGTSREVAIDPLPETDRWRVRVPDGLEAGTARLEVAYEGRLGEGMSGLYRSEAGDEVCLATQCEPSDARRVFPCFDEPAFKAPIAWRVRADDELRVLANGELAETREHEDGTSTRVFAATPPISSYLAALAVGDFQATEVRDHRGVPFQVWALGEGHELGDHARDQAARLMAWFEDYFEQPYPYAKYDQLAVPSFSFGAMENVGLVVFRESLLLLDRDRATWDEEKAVDRVVAHELAHMWFGNLVTMAWWDDLWLNEAFAEWIAHEAVDQLEPEHEVWHAFRQRTDQALATDALDSTHAIYNPVETPAEAMEMFDAITYGKGSAVMRMLAAYLGEDAFQQGLSTYVRSFAEANARGSDLWTHLAQASDEPVGDVVRAWITQPGHPCVEVRLERETETGVELSLAQDRHRARRSTTLQAPTWPVPIVLGYADRAGVHETRVLLRKDQRSIELDTEGPLAWLVANADQEGFYRVDHGEELESRLVEHARELSPAETWGLVRDSLSLVKAGERGMREHLELLDQLATGQAHFALVDDLVGHVRSLERWLQAHDDEAALEGLQAWTRATFGPALDELGARPAGGEDPSRRHRRATVLGAVAGIGGDPEALDEVAAIAEAERDDPDALEPEVATAAVRVAARAGQVSLSSYLEAYERRRDAGEPPQQVQRYLHSLPLFREDASVDQLLDHLAEGTFPAQSQGPLLEALLARPHAQAATMRFVADNLDELQRRLGTAWIARVAEALGEATPGHLARAESLLAEIRERAPESSERALERLEQTRELVEAGAIDKLAAWAREQG